MRKNFKSSPSYKAMEEAAKVQQLAQFEWWSSDDGRKRRDEMRDMEAKHPRLKPWIYGQPYRSGWKDVWMKCDDYTSYIDVSEADAVQKKALVKWLVGQTCPKIPGVEMSCYEWDYRRFVDSFYRGEMATNND